MTWKNLAVVLTLLGALNLAACDGSSDSGDTTNERETTATADDTNNDNDTSSDNDTTTTGDDSDNDGDSGSTGDDTEPTDDDSGSDTEPTPTNTFLSADIQASGKPKQAQLIWEFDGSADHYVLESNPDGSSGFSAMDRNGDGTIDEADYLTGDRTSTTVTIPLYLTDLNNVQYRLTAEDADGNTLDATSSLSLLNVAVNEMIGYFKASNTGLADHFGLSFALSGDGNTLAVGARNEDSASRGINGDDSDDSSHESGAVYIFAKDETGLWQQQAYIKASNADKGDRFGWDISISDDGNTLAVNAPLEDSSGTGVNSRTKGNNDGHDVGAIYIFKRTEGNWSEAAYIKPPQYSKYPTTGNLALSPDGQKLVVAMSHYYIYQYSIGPQGVVGEGLLYEHNVSSLSLNNNGWLAVGYAKDDTSTGVVHIVAPGGDSAQVIKASNAEANASFGYSVALSRDGETLAVGAPNEDDFGAVYTFAKDTSGDWAEEAYIKPSSSVPVAEFGADVALSSDGEILAVGAPGESGSDTGINGQQSNNGSTSAGAVYVFKRDDTGSWGQRSYVKASNTDAHDQFGEVLSLSADGRMLAVSAPVESSNATGINGDQTNNDLSSAGAVYLY